jgi:hypothetical protein
MSILNINRVEEYMLIDNYIYNNEWVVIRLQDNPNIEDVFNNNSIRNIVDCIQYRMIRNPSKLKNCSKIKNCKIYKFPKKRIFDIIILQMYNNMELIIDSNIVYKHITEDILPTELIIPIPGDVCIDISVRIHSLKIPFIYECNILINDLMKELSLKKFYNKQKIYFDNTEQKVYSVEKQILKKSKSKFKLYCLIM